MSTRVDFLLAEAITTEVLFYHVDWPEANKHYEISGFCWAMYLRILKRYAEHDEQVPYEQRLDV